MGISIEFNPDLCLRKYSEFTNGVRKKEECLPKNLEPNTTHSFLKKGQRMYWLDGELPLRKTEGNGVLSKTLASIKILEVSHKKNEQDIWTTGTYKIIEVYNDDLPHFDGLEKI